MFSLWPHPFVTGSCFSCWQAFLRCSTLSFSCCLLEFSAVLSPLLRSFVYTRRCFFFIVPPFRRWFCLDLLFLILECVFPFPLSHVYASIPSVVSAVLAMLGLVGAVARRLQIVSIQSDICGTALTKHLSMLYRGD